MILVLLFRCAVTLVCFRVLVSAQFDGCVDTLNAIALRESIVTDTSFPRTYVLCPDLDYPVGFLDFNRLVQNGQPMIPLRSNLKIQCGQDGSRENSCRIKGGDVHVDGTDHYGVGKRTLENVVLEGLTFVNSSKYMASLNQPGEVHFVDCEFRENRFVHTPVWVDFFNNRGRDDSLTVNFTDCVFEDNKFNGYPSTPALVVSTSSQNRLVFERNRFRDNDMLNSWDLSNNQSYVAVKSFLVEASGPLTMTQNCFEDNVMGTAPVALYGPGDTRFFQNYEFLSSGSSCTFVADFRNPVQFDAFVPSCEPFDLAGFDAVCPLDFIGVPTSNPTAKPVGPTAQPSSAPSFSSRPPSASPSLSFAPSPSPTDYPTFPPTDAPTFNPTAAPTAQQTEFPTVAPTSVPTGLPTEEDVAVASPVDVPSDILPTGIPSEEILVPPIDSVLTSIPTDSPEADQSPGDVVTARGSSGLVQFASFCLCLAILGL